MIEFKKSIHVDALSGEELRLLAVQDHLIIIALADAFRASRQPACEHVYAAGKRAYDDTHDLVLAVKVCNHDNLEDGHGRVTFEDLRAKLNGDIALTVLSLTKPEDAALTQEECLEVLIEQIVARAQVDWHALFAKASDSWHNNVTADDFILLAQSESELSIGKRRRRRCFVKTQGFYLPMFARHRSLVPGEHRDSFDRIVGEIDQISAYGLSSPEPPSQFDLFSDAQVAIPTRA